MRKNESSIAKTEQVQYFSEKTYKITNSLKRLAYQTIQLALVVKNIELMYEKYEKDKFYIVEFVQELTNKKVRHQTNLKELSIINYSFQLFDFTLFLGLIAEHERSMIKKLLDYAALEGLNIEDIDFHLHVIGLNQTTDFYADFIGNNLSKYDSHYPLEEKYKDKYTPFVNIKYVEKSINNLMSKINELIDDMRELSYNFFDCLIHNLLNSLEKFKYILLTVGCYGHIPPKIIHEFPIDYDVY